MYIRVGAFLVLFAVTAKFIIISKQNKDDVATEKSERRVRILFC